MALVHGPKSEKANEARRRNAAKSTGPQTREGLLQAAQNVLRAARYARSPQAAMVRMGEDPSELEKLRQELTAALQPQTAAERLQVEQIAWLHWEQRRTHKARLWKRARRLEEMDLERERQWQEAETKTCLSTHEEVMSEGLMRREPSPSKYAMLAKYLGILVRAAERHDFDIDYEGLLRLLYGNKPTLRGNGLLNNFRICAKEAREAERKPGRKRKTLQYQILMQLLYEEERDVLTGRYHYMSHVVNISTARRQAALAATREDQAAINEHSGLAYQLESAYRVLFAMQQKRQRAPAVASETESKPRAIPECAGTFRGDEAGCEPGGEVQVPEAGTDRETGTAAEEAEKQDGATTQGELAG